MRGIFTTSIMWHDSTGGEVEARVRVTYSRFKGFAGDWTDPPEPAAVEIVSIFPLDSTDPVPDHFLTDESLIEECLEDWANEEVEAAEWREQSRRDSLMGGF